MAANAVKKNEERRDYRRVSDAVALQFNVIEDQGTANEPDIDSIDLPDYPTHVVSLSPNGLKCYHTERFSDGDTVTVSLKFFPGLECLDLVATVVGAGEENARSKSNRFFAGLAFGDLTDEAREVILGQIESVARQSFSGAVKLVN